MNINLTPSQERRRKAIERRFQKVLLDLAALADEVQPGRDHHLYYEGEGDLYAIDSEATDKIGEDEQGAVVLSITRNVLGQPRMDCGAW